MLHEGVWLGERERRGSKCVCEEREYDGGVERAAVRERDERLGVT